MDEPNPAAAGEIVERKVLVCSVASSSEDRAVLSKVIVPLWACLGV